MKASFSQTDQVDIVEQLDAMSVDPKRRKLAINRHLLHRQERAFPARVKGKPCCVFSDPCKCGLIFDRGTWLALEVHFQHRGEHRPEDLDSRQAAQTVNVAFRVPCVHLFDREDWLSNSLQCR
jgi:hypothetical protein